MSDGPKRQISAKQRAVLDRGRKTAARNRRRRIDSAVWRHVKPKIDTHHCRCGLRRGMSLDELRALNGGCTDPNWCCPVLDTYRRLLENPSSMGEKL
jgi:hypothetical protein